MPGAKDNRRNDYMVRGNYTTSRPTAWILQETEVRNLKDNIAVISKRFIGLSGKLSIRTDKITRGAPDDLGNAVNWETALKERGTGISTSKIGRRRKSARL